MNYTTLISPEQLATSINLPNWIIFDCRFSLADTEAGARAYRRGHLPNARYAHLDKDLSSAITDFTGRHPLPHFGLLSKKLGQWGVDTQSQIVVYDDAGGAFAGRMWWLLKTLGHDTVAVLDGGIPLWQKHQHPITTTLPIISTKEFRPYLDDTRWVNALQVQNDLAGKKSCVIDARTLERFKGLQEPVDPVAGHVPGAINRPFQLNLNPDGSFKTADKLREQFLQLLGRTQPEQVVHMCGSGVTACHNLLAMEIAGLKGSKLYAGSWSEWIRDKNRPVVQQKC
ncbi:MAG: sulfurtransferase [Methylicorpusculum sp.]|uniref:sulfurtransferase n=1 Tax=Methylicorpusculum sp. TaxID=2713644 RepID=UPI0027288189|nr:sulfurtransferase [Methylicorpusculum sp.]MDO8939204.1 sulfurtransferase [Methylicorpusculum sp.]MDP2204157.1 sulfurtransferase [Methylicorpusculum sp.]